MTSPHIEKENQYNPASLQTKLTQATNILAVCHK